MIRQNDNLEYLDIFGRVWSSDFWLFSAMLKRFAWLLCCVLVAQCAGATCEFDEGEFYSFQEIVDCFYSIPLEDDIKYTTLETLKRSLEIYTFYDIAHNSPDPNLPLKVDMQRGLEIIANRTYSLDFEFQSDLSNLYLQVHVLLYFLT